MKTLAEYLPRESTDVVPRHELHIRSTHTVLHSYVSRVTPFSVDKDSKPPSSLLPPPVRADQREAGQINNTVRYIPMQPGLSETEHTVLPVYMQVVNKGCQFVRFVGE